MLCGSFVPAPYRRGSIRENVYARLMPLHTGPTAASVRVRMASSGSASGS